MSDIFADIYKGIKGPDVVMNKGPLPPTDSSGMPAGFDGTPDGRINQSSSLLGDVQPYSYGGPARLSTQAAYLNVPHAVGRIVPPVKLPEPTIHGSNEFFTLTHQVDDGDVAFVIRALYSPYEIVDCKNRYGRQGLLYAIDPVVNVFTLNYILHGLQRYGCDESCPHWRTLWIALGLDDFFPSAFRRDMYAWSIVVRASYDGSDLRRQVDTIAPLVLSFVPSEEERAKVLGTFDAFKQAWQPVEAMLKLRECRRLVCDHVVQNCITPFGVPRGSEKQGGQHQGLAYKAVTWPVDHVTSMLIDGKVSNLVNLWRHHEVCAGDDLIMYLREEATTEYTLTHNPKGMRRLTFPPLQDVKMPSFLVDGGAAKTGRGARMRRNLREKVMAAVQLEEWFPRKVEGFEEERKKDPDQLGIQEVMRILTGYAGEHEGAEWQEMCRMQEVREPIFQLIPGVRGDHRPSLEDAVDHGGYWHIARTQVMQFAFKTDVPVHSGSLHLTNGRLLEGTFSPVWVGGTNPSRATGKRRRDEKEEEEAAKDPVDPGPTGPTLLSFPSRAPGRVPFPGKGNVLNPYSLPYGATTVAECAPIPTLAGGPGALSASAPDLLSSEAPGPKAIPAPGEKTGAKGRAGERGHKAKRAVQSSTSGTEAEVPAEGSVFERITAQLLESERAD